MIITFWVFYEPSNHSRLNEADSDAFCQEQLDRNDALLEELDAVITASDVQHTIKCLKRVKS